jgi:hypothetical protein
MASENLVFADSMVMSMINVYHATGAQRRVWQRDRSGTPYAWEILVVDDQASKPHGVR